MIEQRHQLNLTQRELADLCGIPHSSVARIESGKTTPNLSTLLKIFQKLGITLTATPINAELVELDKARKMPITYDEDCPETTPEMAMRFRRVNPVRNAMS